MDMMKKQGLEYASPFIQILEIASENVLLTASDENGRGFILEDYEDDGTF